MLDDRLKVFQEKLPLYRRPRSSSIDLDKSIIRALSEQYILLAYLKHAFYRRTSLKNHITLPTVSLGDTNNLSVTDLRHRNLDLPTPEEQDGRQSLPPYSPVSY